ncbi:hypothetical protein SAMD00019534_015710 [Acytostelium subglobosum LB1]|uniref:hypothetical protein n=1 Tax=Acytostelium subglobosum LB1 TaxID=1410327 RepID=UPI00064503EB|nr:hypothetical protein SAMD00019534_015710 [Acytostelium subglobosum LB1]GAM18396.1 hypothetical protein SAMD00019534_015710 [Acytostelium subglobosum LB1]|eukprot:XP_012757616.1 hypothetical protein SAMD00019534_015710 [Acytostelium subglobosum LB1]
MFGEAKCDGDCDLGQLCINNTCSACESDAQCQSMVNSQNVCKNGLCTHKSLFHNKLTGLDFAGFILLFIGCALSSGGGIGGGGIYIPILILIDKFDPKEAIPLSNCLVAGCSLANLIQNFPRRHPNANKHLIDYAVVLLIEPLTLGGTTFGIYLHTMLPSYVILILLVLTLFATAATTLKKGVDLYKKERVTKEYNLLVNDTNDGSLVMEPPNPFMDADWFKIFSITGILILSTLFSVFKGGNQEYSIVGVKLCSPGYWVLAFAIWPVVMVAWALTSRFLYSQWLNNQTMGISIEGDIRYTRKTIILLGLLSIMAGVLASLLGIGGGMIKGPVLLSMGLSPDIVAATSSFMILFTSASSAFQYILLNKLALDYGLVYYIIGFVACFVGTQTLIWVVKKYKRRSYIIFLISSIIILSTILLVSTEVIEIERYPKQKFVSVCVPGDAGGD